MGAVTHRTYRKFRGGSMTDEHRHQGSPTVESWRHPESNGSSVTECDSSVTVVTQCDKTVTEVSHQPHTCAYPDTNAHHGSGKNIESNSDSVPRFHSSKLRQLMAVAGISMGCVLDGVVIAYSSPAIPSLIESSMEVDSHEMSWIGSIHAVGAVLGCLLASPAMTRLGRRGAALAVMCPAYLIGFLLIVMSQSVNTVISGRWMGGVGLGLTLSITPVYLVEVTTIEIRGMLGVLPPLMTQVGVLLTYILGSWLNWRSLALFGSGLVLPLLLFVWAVPESPVFYVSKGQLDAAERSLISLGRQQDTVRFFKEIQNDLDLYKDSLNADSWRQYFDLRSLRPFLACLGLMLFFQATGYSTIIAYALPLFRESGSRVDEHLTSGITGVVILVSAVIAMGLAKVVSRKVLLGISSLGAAI